MPKSQINIAVCIQQITLFRQLRQWILLDLLKIYNSWVSAKDSEDFLRL